MKIDGYTAPDPKIATEQGVDFIYDLPKIGSIKIQSRTLNARHNPAFGAAYKKHSDWVDKQTRLGGDIDDKETAKRLIEIMYDSGVIRWSTTIKSEGKVIEPTRENFIALMTSDACFRVAAEYLAEASQDEHFRPKTQEEDAKNSEASSDGKTSGQDAKTS